MRPFSELLNYLIVHKFNMAIQDWLPKQLKMNDNNVLVIKKTFWISIYIWVNYAGIKRSYNVVM